MDSKFRRFGAGCCGSVWASGKGPAFKREDGDPNRSLRNDYEIHKRVLNNLTQLTDMKSKRKGIESVDKFPQIQVPQCYRSIRPHDTDWWKDNQHRLPDGYEACNTLQSERIAPFREPCGSYRLSCIVRRKLSVRSA